VRIVANSSVKFSWLNYEGGEMSEFLYFWVSTQLRSKEVGDIVLKT
jgi:hypothetical protein